MNKTRGPGAQNNHFAKQEWQFRRFWARRRTKPRYLEKSVAKQGLPDTMYQGTSRVRATQNTATVPGSAYLEAPLASCADSVVLVVVLFQVSAP